MVEMRRLSTAGIANPKTTDQIRKCKKSDWGEKSMGETERYKGKLKERHGWQSRLVPKLYFTRPKIDVSFWRRSRLRC